jgi:predicted permease
MNGLWITLSIICIIVGITATIITFLFVLQLFNKQQPDPRKSVVAMWLCASVTFYAGAYLISRLIEPVV